MEYNGLNFNGGLTNLYQYPLNNVNRLEVTPNLNNNLPTNENNYIGGLPFSREVLTPAINMRNPNLSGVVGNSPEQMAFYSENYRNANYYAYPQIPITRPNIQYMATTAPFYKNMIVGERVGIIRPN